MGKSKIPMHESIVIPCETITDQMPPSLGEIKMGEGPGSDVVSACLGPKGGRRPLMPRSCQADWREYFVDDVSQMYKTDREPT